MFRIGFDDKWYLKQELKDILSVGQENSWGRVLQAEERTGKGPEAGSEQMHLGTLGTWEGLQETQQGLRLER